MSEKTVCKLRWAVLVGVLLVGCVIGASLAVLAVGQGGAGLAATAYAGTIAPESQRYIVEAVNKVGPAVVNIRTLVQPETSGLPPILREFFGEPFPRQGQASGVIIDARGHVLTNSHVVENAQEVKVTLADGRTFDATVVGADPVSDIAIVRISGNNLPVAELGTSEDKPIGSWVIAIGNPFGYENTVTVGVLGARNRSLRAPSGVVLDDLLQTDAAINPGNSGGALVDIEGKVIGIPTVTIRYAQGIGFAISAERARRAAAQLIETGRVSHPWLGIRYISVTEEIQRQLNLPDRKGVLVRAVESGSPAEQAGIEPDDIIIRVAKREVTDSEIVAEVVRESTVGQALAVTVRRDGREINLTVVIGERPLPRE